MWGRLCSVICLRQYLWLNTSIYSQRQYLVLGVYPSRSLVLQSPKSCQIFTFEFWSKHITNARVNDTYFLTCYILYKNVKSIVFWNELWTTRESRANFFTKIWSQCLKIKTFFFKRCFGRNKGWSSTHLWKINYLAYFGPQSRPFCLLKCM